jgi:SAM-dependent methyltransferase
MREKTTTSETRGRRAAAVRCLLCGDTARGWMVVAPRLRDAANRRVVRCPGCGHVQVDPLPDERELTAYYREQENVKVVGVDPFLELERMFQRNVNDITRRAQVINNLLPANQSVLEIGQGSGFVLEMLAKLGHRCWGDEIRESEFNKPADDVVFDCLILSHVLEHLLDPVATMHDVLARYRFRPGALVYLEVPNHDDYMRAVEAYERFFYHYSHLSYFTPRALGRLVAAVPRIVDFRIYGVQRYSVLNAANWVLRGEPMLESPMFTAPPSHAFLESFYKAHVEERLVSDTIMGIGQLTGEAEAAT